MLLALGVLMRTAHVVAAAAWVGGSIFYLVALGPALRAGGPVPQVATRVAALFRKLVNICMGALLATGVYLTFDRLASNRVGTAYVVALGLKIAVALGMFGLALYQAQEGASRLRSNPRRLGQAVPGLILAAGLLAFLLGAVLTQVFESALAGS